ncbi:MAG TPA: hypothetical protein VKY19_00680 [Ktedonosporobacter sp.]|jgi:hypothetical protein|nr:hypothetical protein [Ktedonosporobacter sp.]
MKLALKITPQRTTQYAHMTASLATPELLASPLAAAIDEVAPVTLAGQSYLLATLDVARIPSPTVFDSLFRLGAISEVYEYFDSAFLSAPTMNRGATGVEALERGTLSKDFERIGEVAGPLLRPLEPRFTPFVPLEMAEARRYRGKTNEVFTRVLLNVALFAGAYREQYTQRLRILDPLAGGGTTLFLALAYGYDAFGIELERQDVETTAVFVRQYFANEGMRVKEIDERSRKAGRRHQFEIGPKGETRLLVLAHGNAREAALHMREVAGGPRMHAIVGDLPYGIQHFGEIASLLSESLPVWERMLLPGGSLALAWNATRIERAALVELIECHSSLYVLNEPPYTRFAHAVDRVIKKRDIVVAVSRQAGSRAGASPAPTEE